MFMNLIYIILNIILILNLFSYYNTFFLSVEILLFLLFIFIILNIFRLSSKLLINFLVQQKNIIIEEYYNKFFDFYFFLNFYKNNLILYLKNMIYNIIFFKYILNIFNNFFRKKISNYKFIINYLINNFLNTFLLENLILKKIKIKILFIVLLKKFLFFKLYLNLGKFLVNRWISNI